MPFPRTPTAQTLFAVPTARVARHLVGMSFPVRYRSTRRVGIPIFHQDVSYEQHAVGLTWVKQQTHEHDRGDDVDNEDRD